MLAPFHFESEVSVASSPDSKTEELTRVWLDEFEHNATQANDLYRAWALAAITTWTGGVRSTVEAYGATGQHWARALKDWGTRESLEKLAGGMREVAQRASDGYASALREGVAHFERVQTKGHGTSKG